MKHSFLLSLLFIIACSESGEVEPTTDLFAVAISSAVTKQSDGSLELDAFNVETAQLERINTSKQTLNEYSLGIITYTDGNAEPTDVAVASLTMDLEFVDLKGIDFEAVASIPDSLFRVSSGSMPIVSGDVFAVISKTRSIKVEVTAASFRINGVDVTSEAVLRIEYLE